VSEAGGRRNRNGAVSGHNLPLNVRTTVKSLKEKARNRFYKLRRNCQCKFIFYFVRCVENRSDYLA